MGEVFNVLLVGVGGQGIVLAGDIIAEAAAIEGNDVKKSEIHGMSRRGGPVFSHVRFGPQVYSPVITEGKADVILALEPMELLRWTSWAAPDAAAVYLASPMLPVGLTAYPGGIEDEIGRLFGRLVRVEASALKPAVAMKVRNTALLGAASVFVPLAAESFDQALDVLAPRGTQDQNKAAFAVGRALALDALPEVAHVE